MGERAVVVADDEREWEGWPADQVPVRGEVRWKTMLSACRAASDSITLGVGRLRSGEHLREHRHPQSEAYLVLAGELTLRVAGESQRVRPGDAAFVSGGALHSLVNEGADETRFAYAFAADAAQEIAYEFPGE